MSNGKPHHYTFLYFYDEAVSFAAGIARARNAGERATTPFAPRGPRASGRSTVSSR